MKVGLGQTYTRSRKDLNRFYITDNTLSYRKCVICAVESVQILSRARTSLHRCSMCVRMLKQNKSEYDVNSHGKTEYTPRHVFAQNRMSTGRKGSQNWKCAEVQIVLRVPVLDD